MSGGRRQAWSREATQGHERGCQHWALRLPRCLPPGSHCHGGEHGGGLAAHTAPGAAPNLGGSHSAQLQHKAPAASSLSTPPPPPPLRKTKPESGSCGDQPQSLTVGFCNEMANRGRHRDNPRLSPSCRHRGGRVALCWGCGAGKNWEVTLGGSRVLREVPRLPH